MDKHTTRLSYQFQPPKLGLRINTKERPLYITKEEIDPQKQILEIYKGIPGPGLGNHWRTINYALRISEKEGRPRYYDDSYRKEKVHAIYNVLDSKGKLIFINRNIEIPNKTKKIIKLNERHNLPYCPTKTKWTPGPYGQIVYQLDGRSDKHTKNPPQEDLDKLIKLFSATHKMIKLGGRKTLQEEIEIAAKSDLFIGVCSGMSHLCHSVGLPMFLIKHKHEKIIRWHEGNSYTLCQEVEDCIEKVQEFLIQ